jgi:hypothetical protein
MTAKSNTRARFAWFLFYAVELHLVAALAMAPPVHASPSYPTTKSLDEFAIDIAAPAPSNEIEKEEVAHRPIAASPMPSPRRGRPVTRPPSNPGSAPAAAASVVSSPEVGEPIPVGTAPTYPGGLTSSTGTGNEFGDEIGSGGAGLVPFDLSAPAHLDGRRAWTCVVDGAPDRTIVRVRALVRPDGSAVRAELVDDDGQAAEAVLRGAMPCAMREQYIPGRDRDGRLVLRWTRPFRVVVVGVGSSVASPGGAY